MRRVWWLPLLEPSVRALQQENKHRSNSHGKEKKSDRKVLSLGGVGGVCLGRVCGKVSGSECNDRDLWSLTFSPNSVLVRMGCISGPSHLCGRNGGRKSLGFLCWPTCEPAMGRPKLHSTAEKVSLVTSVTHVKPHKKLSSNRDSWLKACRNYHKKSIPTYKQKYFKGVRL